MFRANAIVLLACIGAASGQQRITGVVTDGSRNTAMAGVKVVIDGNFIGVIAILCVAVVGIGIVAKRK